MAAEERIRELEDALRDAMEMLEDLPSGVDHEADPDNPSPLDAAAHTGGLIWQRLNRVARKG